MSQEEAPAHVATGSAEGDEDVEATIEEMLSRRPVCRGKQRLVHFLVVAEFDIDTGSEVRIRYPAAPPGIEPELFSEMMLPDGVHNRKDDWTTFFLYRQDQKASMVKAQAKAGPVVATTINPLMASAHDVASLAGGSAALPQTKEVSAFIYKFVSAGEEGSWQLAEPEEVDPSSILLHSDKVALLTSSGDVLSEITVHVNLEYQQVQEGFVVVLGNTGVPWGLRFEDTKDENAVLDLLESMYTSYVEPEGTGDAAEGDFGDVEEDVEGSQGDGSGDVDEAGDEKEDDADGGGGGGEEEEEEEEEVEQDDIETMPFLYCISRVSTMKDSSVRRGAVCKAMAICSRYPYVHVFKPVLLLALDNYFKSPTEDTVRELYNAINSLDVEDMPLLNLHEKVMSKSVHANKEEEFETKMLYGSALNIKIPVSLFPDEMGDVNLIPLYTRMKKSLMTIYNAVFTQKRVLFVAMRSNTEELCNLVLATLAMVCPPLNGLIQRAFPYTNLTNLEFVATPGYVAGVANPVFIEHPEWWDLMITVETAEITVTPKLAEDEAYNEMLKACHRQDAEFMGVVDKAINERRGERVVRRLFQDYTQHLIDIHFGDEVFKDESHKKRAVESNKLRLEMWTRTISYTSYLETKERISEQASIRNRAVPKMVKQLRAHTLSDDQVTNIFETFHREVNTADQLFEFNSLLPASKHQLFPIAVGMFHHLHSVRRLAVELLARLETGLPSTMISLNPFFALAFDRLCIEFGVTRNAPPRRAPPPAPQSPSSPEKGVEAADKQEAEEAGSEGS